MFAFIESGGKQHRVAEGESIRLELLSSEEGSVIEFDKVLLVSNGKDSKVGNPFVENAKVSAKVVRHGKGDKVKVFKMKRRKNYKRTYGHRQAFTEVQIEKITS